MRKARLPDSASFLAGLLVHFGVFSSATLDLRTGSLRLGLLTRSLSPSVYATFRRKLTDALAVLHELDRRPSPQVRIRREGSGRVARIEIVRSMEDLSYEELAVIAQMARDLLPLEAVQEGPWTEEEREAQEERLRAALEQVRELRGSRRYVGLREGAEVLIYAATELKGRVRGS